MRNTAVEQSINFWQQQNTYLGIIIKQKNKLFFSQRREIVFWVAGI